LWLGLAVPAFAENPLGLQDNHDYDIYVGYPGGEQIVIQTVRIMGVKEIYDEVFLVVRSDSFDAARSEGLVKYDRILAVLPSHRGTVLQRPVGYKKF